MKKTLLFPTDFSIASLQLVRSALQQLDAGQSCHLVLLYGHHGSDSITSLLFQSRGRQADAHSNPAFEEALAVLKNKYGSRIASIRKDVFSGYNQRAFDQYIEANGIDQAFIPAEGTVIPESRKGFDLLPYLRRCKQLQPVELAVRNPEYPGENGKLSALFAGSLTAN